MQNEILVEATSKFSIAFGGLLLLAFTGCHLRLDLGPPGTIGMQRDRAVLHDPYPRNDLGPAIESGRPRGFDIPRAETVDYQDNPFSHISLRNPNLLRPAASANFGANFGVRQNFSDQRAITPPGFATQPGLGIQTPQLPVIQQPGLGQQIFSQPSGPPPSYPFSGSGFSN